MCERMKASAKYTQPLGRTITQSEESICIDGEEIDVKASIHVMSGYSAHVDQSELLALKVSTNHQRKYI